MATKKPAKMAHDKVGADVAIKDDGVKYAVVNTDDKRVYDGEGVALPEAVRLARSLVALAGVARIESDGSLTLGRVDLETGVFTAPEVAVAA